MLSFRFHACWGPWPCKQGEDIPHLFSVFFFQRNLFTFRGKNMGNALCHSVFKLKKHLLIPNIWPPLFQKRNKRPHTTFSYSQAILICIAIFFSVSPKLLLSACRKNWNILELEQTGGSLLLELSWDLYFFGRGAREERRGEGLTSAFFSLHFLWHLNQAPRLLP